MKNLLKILAILFVASQAVAQGTISGTIIDEEFGETLIGANVVIEGTTTGTATDFDGKYQFPAEPGTYTLVVSYIGYGDKKIEGVEVADGEITYLDVSMGGDEAVELDLDIVVQAKAIERTENALLLLQKKSDKIQDGISSQEMSRFAVSNAAGAMTKVSGATVQGGKYIYIRGLGDRYSLAQLNGLNLPSTDPYRNSAQLDLIPTSLLDNIITSKTFTPDLPGTFTGGNVDIKTKTLPEQFFLNVSASVGYNTNATGQDDFIVSDGGNTDWLGIDDGGREHPSFLQDPSTNQYLGRSIDLAARSGDLEAANTADRAVKTLQNDFTPSQETAPLNHGLGISFGNQYALGETDLGVIMSARYKRTYTHNAVDDLKQDLWEFRPNQPELFNLNDFRTVKSTDNPELNGLLGLSLKFSPSHKISLLGLYNVNTDNSTYMQSGDKGQNLKQSLGLLFFGSGISWNERQLQGAQLGGEHVFGEQKIRLEWKAGLTNSSLDNNIRVFEYVDILTNDNFQIPLADVTQPSHYFRSLTDEELITKLDVTIPFAQGKSKSNKLKFGGFLSRKDRDFEEFIYTLITFFQNTDPFVGDIDAFTSESNLGIIGSEVLANGTTRFNMGLSLDDQTEPGNKYIGQDNVTAAYGMVTYNLSPNLKAIAGARLEQTELIIEGFASATEQIESSIDQANLLPSLNLVYTLKENMNLRGGISKTIARPNMREKAPFRSFDPEQNIFYLGNIDLDLSEIWNYDLRWEYFFNPGEVIAVSAYLKDFTDPIILNYISSSNIEIKYDNAPKGRVSGLEVEFRKGLGFISPTFERFKFNTNFSFIESSLDPIDEGDPEDRPFEGQAPFILNAGLNYQNVDGDWDITVALNRVGDRLFIIGSGGVPDFYQQARNQLDLTVLKKIGDLNLSFSVKNILDDPYEILTTFEGVDYNIERYTRGVGFNLGLSYTIR